MLTTRGLSAGERLLIHRRRHGASQVIAARMWNVKPWTYRMWEDGHRTHDVPKPNLGTLKPHEAWFIMRRRKGMKRTDLAKAIGLSCWWVTRMERGEIPCDRLAVFWS